MAMSYTMEYKGFKAQIMEANRLEGDYVHGLPPGDPLPVYQSEAFKKYPDNWMKGPGVFIVPVRPNKGLWFDWRGNLSNNTAILPTIKGCNPITGIQTSGFHLERYEEKCPKHGVAFEGDRYCPKCEYKWPPQNYVCRDPMWWDGWFNAKDGTVRQFFFTEEEMRDIASKLIGKENTVPAFGFAFYRPKEMRSAPRMRYKTYSPYDDSEYLDGTGSYVNSKEMYVTYSNSSSTSGLLMASDSCSSFSDVEIRPDSVSCQIGGILRSKESRDLTISKKAVKEVSVGAGAKIDQNLDPDPYDLDSWKDTPDASMTIYFVFQEKLEELKAGGMKSLEGKEEGMLEGLPVG
ncbi:MAG: hypothetical protein GF334_05185 [Candidatus Altiarchaeales archaeon]|nr:hypothetical protein [Candidatus Altiarchaeales archaeon]